MKWLKCSSSYNDDVDRRQFFQTPGEESVGSLGVTRHSSDALNKLTTRYMDWG